MHTEPDLAFAGLAAPLRLDDVLFVAAKSNRIAPLQVLNAAFVIGPDHLRSAARHALRAQAEGRMEARSVEVEFVRYAAGERKIQHALGKMGVLEGGAGVAVALGPKAPDALAHFLHALCPAEDDSVLAASTSKLLDFGISATALSATTPERHLDLVLEAVALVDLRSDSFKYGSSVAGHGRL